MSQFSIAKWETVELKFRGKADGNPFVDYEIRGVFTGAHESIRMDGFYDGEGVYIVRFMPSFEGEYTYSVSGSFSDEPHEGAFTVTQPLKHNHGPVRVNGLHFAYEDGLPYREAGTTCYAWTHQSDAMVEKTLKTLSGGTFNKVRFCIFPKHFDYNLWEPATYPYEGTPCKMDGTYTGAQQQEPLRKQNKWDFTRFNPEHFRRIDRAVQALGEMGIEADLIIMHPYDCWGFSTMTPEQDDLYWKYAMARYSAYRNVWWAFANEYDFLSSKTVADWERYASIVLEKDPYNHLRSIHHCFVMYDHSRPWITHCSVQGNCEQTAELRMRYKKPVVFDEFGYEGNIEWGWGNLSAQELVHRFWTTVVSGGYAGHGETYYRDDGMLWWSHGGELYGESEPRIAFLRKIMEEVPGRGLDPVDPRWVGAARSTCGAQECLIQYFGRQRPFRFPFQLDPEKKYRVEVIDTWNMTIEDRGVFSGQCIVQLPSREYMAVRMRRVEES